MNAEVTALFEEPDWTCRRCRTVRPRIDFGRAGPGRRRKICRMCRSEVDMEQRKGRRSPESRIRERLKGQYGITVEQYEEMLSDQQGVCAICQNPPAKKQRLHVDHCHASGRVRALLCGPCNLQLGAYEKLRDQAAAYLVKYGAGNPLLNYDAAPDSQSSAA